RSGRNPAILSAAYLLASDGPLWDWTTNPALSKRNGYREIVKDPKRQTLLNAASGLYRGTLPVSPDSLCDKRHTEDTLFRLIFTAFIVRRYGAAVIFAESGEIA
ncbi:MAG: hypothetical protein LBT32_07430, partial [Peptococcaceae bacterium]|nr:hypothetical protein [Peptococcaceae bacterium]